MLKRNPKRVDIARPAADVQGLNKLPSGAKSAALATDSSILHVLRLLDATPNLTQREMARDLGVSLGKTNYCIRALLTRGFVKVQNFRRSRTKRGYVYLLTPEGLAAKADLTRDFLARKRAEYDALRLEIERLQGESAGL